MASDVRDDEVVLKFWSKRAKDAFMGQLSDGWGENLVQFTWPWQAGVKFHEATEFTVQSFFDPSGGEKDERYRDDWWHAPGFDDGEEG